MGMDAWFDVLTALPGTEFTQALVSAVPELALAGLCTWLALRGDPGTAAFKCADGLMGGGRLDRAPTWPRP
jgi:hypothetical protein